MLLAESNSSSNPTDESSIECKVKQLADKGLLKPGEWQYSLTGNFIKDNLCVYETMKAIHNLENLKEKSVIIDVLSRTCLNTKIIDAVLIEIFYLIAYYTDNELIIRPSEIIKKYPRPAIANLAIKDALLTFFQKNEEICNIIDSLEVCFVESSPIEEKKLKTYQNNLSEKKVFFSQKVISNSDISQDSNKNKDDNSEVKTSSETLLIVQNSK